MPITIPNNLANGAELDKDALIPYVRQLGATAITINPSSQKGGLDAASIAALSASRVQVNALTFDRPPYPTDNSSQGFTVNSIWQANGELSQPSAAPDTTAGNWAAQSGVRAGAPGSVMGANGICIGGLRQFVPGFTGAAIQITATVSSTPVTTDVSILTGGKFDKETAWKVLNSADAGTMPYVTKIYDQSGNGNHVIYSALSGKISRALYLLWAPSINDFQIGSDEVYGNANGQALAFPATVSLASDNMGAYFFGTGVTSYAGGNVGMIASFGTGTTAAVTLHTGQLQTGPTLASWAATKGAKAPAEASQVALNNRMCVASISCSGTNTILACNEHSATIAFSQVSTTLTGGYLGNWDFDNNKYSAMRFSGFAVTNATPTAAQDRAIRNWAYVEFNIRPQVRDRVIVIADSRGSLPAGSFATYGKPGNNIATQLSEFIKSDVEVINCQMIGWTSANVAASAVPGIVATCPLYRKTYIVNLYGVNDFIKSSLTPDKSLSAIATNNATLRSAGCTVIQIAEMANTTTTGSANTNVPVLRALIQNGGSGADYVINFQNNNSVMAASNTTFYPDGLHASETIYKMMAQSIAAIIDADLSSQNF